MVGPVLRRADAFDLGFTTSVRTLFQPVPAYKCADSSSARVLQRFQPNHNELSSFNNSETNELPARSARKWLEWALIRNSGKASSQTHTHTSSNSC
jgi:hypothetical protein